jgi:hypothetical protein
MPCLAIPAEKILKDSPLSRSGGGPAPSVVALRFICAILAKKLAMRSRLFLIMVVSALLASCGFREKQEAQIFYDQLNGINDTVQILTWRWYEFLDTARESQDYTVLYHKRLQLGSYLSEVRSKVANMRPTKNNEKIKNLEELFLAEQAIKVSEVYPLFEQYSGFTPNEVLNGSLKQLGNDRQHMRITINGIKKRLAEYAKLYGLKVKNR